MTLLKKDTNPYILKLVECAESWKEKGILRNFRTLQYVTEQNMSIESINEFQGKNQPSNDVNAYLYTLKSKNPVGLEGVGVGLYDAATYIAHGLNVLHEEKPEVRFASIKDFSDEKLFVIAAYGEDEAYTSTFKGIFKKLKAKLEATGESGYKLITNLNFDHGRNFIRECASYNRLDQFLGTMSPAEQDSLLTWFVEGMSEKEVLEQGVAVADVIASIDDEKILGTISASIGKRYKEAIGSGNKNMEVAYGLLGSLYASKINSTDTFFSSLVGKYPIESVSKVSNKDLFNPNGTSVQRYFFYDDKESKHNDGKASYAHFKSRYENNPNWHINDYGTYIVINSLKGEHVWLVANKPEAEEQGGKDIDSLLGSGDMTVNIAVHRGHSYHLESTTEKLSKRTKVVIAGSCGGYRHMVDILNRSPQSQILSTKGEGTMDINDPMLNTIADEIRLGHDLDWQELWEGFEERFKHDDRFYDYVPPHRNLSYMYVKAFKKMTTKN